MTKTRDKGKPRRPSDFGDYVREQRTKAPAFTVEDLAAKLELSSSYLSEVELGQRAPLLARHWRRLARVLARGSEDRFEEILGELRARAALRSDEARFRYTLQTIADAGCPRGGVEECGTCPACVAERALRGEVPNVSVARGTTSSSLVAGLRP